MKAQQATLIRCATDEATPPSDAPEPTHEAREAAQRDRIETLWRAYVRAQTRWGPHSQKARTAWAALVVARAQKDI